MLSAPRSSPRDPPNDHGRAGTPGTSRPLPTRAELKATLSGDTGPVKSADDARRWMETKGWILTAEPYDRTKLVRVLMTAATIGKGHEFKGDVRNTVLAVAFLLEDNVEDVIATSLADKLTSKVMSQVEGATSRLSSAADFVTATDTARAESTITLKSVADQLQAVSTNLDKVSQTLAAATTRPSPAPPASWANIVKNNTQSSPSTSTSFDPSATDQQTRAQQRAIQLSKSVLVDLDPENSPLTKDRSPAAISQLRTKLNSALQDLDTEYDLFSLDQDTTEARTHIRGLSLTRSGSLLLDFDTPSSAERFKSYTSDPNCTLLTTHLGTDAKVKTRPYVLIVHFVPIAMFNPHDSTHISAFEDDNGLPADSIVSTAWIKKVENRTPRQALASMKITLRSPEVANMLLKNAHVYAAGHLVVVCRDVREPLRCNKCQLYGHMRADCKGSETCATCASTSHATADCDSVEKARCVSCGPSSTHPSSSRSCPAFKKRCDDLNKRFPENLMPLFPTGNPSTWLLPPSKPRAPVPASLPHSLPGVESPPPPEPTPLPPQSSMRQMTLFDVAARTSRPTHTQDDE